LRCGEISLFEFDDVESDAAKAKLDAQRKKRRERYAKNKEQVNARRRETYTP
jgi:predicted DNA-binding WGR domain protein